MYFLLASLALGLNQGFERFVCAMQFTAVYKNYVHVQYNPILVCFSYMTAHSNARPVTQLHYPTYYPITPRHWKINRHLHPQILLQACFEWWWCV